VFNWKIISRTDNIQRHQSIQFPKLQSNQEETKETAEEKQWLFGDRSRNESIKKSKVDWQERAVGHLGKIDKAKSRFSLGNPR
jgi:FtsZ-binding cell division protein ZapB